MTTGTLPASGAGAPSGSLDATPDRAPDQALAEPGERGHLQVAERVVVAIARAAAQEVPGVASPSQVKGSPAGGLSLGGVGEQLSSAVGRTLPRASAQVAGSRARITVELALLWPHPAAAVAQRVREHVSERLAQYAAVSTDSVTVTVTSVVRDARSTTRRVQ
ncbi:Asp23/Gls24 family envelope stress response protein [Quadrisphaera sp. KR29]|uniref:Asp23/Gls24 family envelope stress response protein n=1 Tax=Quadrisphaera sp. KR29 TaxID=3461391 RepID=UPI004043BECF